MVNDGGTAGADAVLDLDGLFPDHGAVLSIEAEGAKGAEVTDDTAAIDDGGGGGVAIEVMDGTGRGDAGEVDLMQQASALQIHAEGFQRHGLLGLQFLELAFLDACRAQHGDLFILGGFDLDRGGDPDLAVRHHGGGPALAWQWCLPGDVFGLAPALGGAVLMGDAVAVRAAEFGPERARVQQAGQDKKGQEKAHGGLNEGRSGGHSVKVRLRPCSTSCLTSGLGKRRLGLMA